MEEVKFLIQGFTLGQVIEDLARQTIKVQTALLSGEVYRDPRLDEDIPEDQPPFKLWRRYTTFQVDDPSQMTPDLSRAAMRDALYALSRSIERSVESGELLTWKQAIDGVR